MYKRQVFYGSVCTHVVAASMSEKKNSPASDLSRVVAVRQNQIPTGVLLASATFGFYCRRLPLPHMTLADLITGTGVHSH